jgi:hypothetical protein
MKRCWPLPAARWFCIAYRPGRRGGRGEPCPSRSAWLFLNRPWPSEDGRRGVPAMPASGINFTASRIRRCSDRRSHFSGGDEIVLERIASKKDDKLSDFLTEAYATVGVAYHRAARVYTMDKEMQTGHCGSSPPHDGNVIHECAKMTTWLDGRPLGPNSFGVPDRISEGSTGQVAGRKTPKSTKNPSMPAMRRAGGPENMGSVARRTS